MLHFLLRRSKSDGQEHSLDVQRASCAAFVAGRGYKGQPVEHVSDGVAGDDVEGLTALRGLIAQLNPGDIVVCRDHSRIGRDMLESTARIVEIVREKRALLFYYSTGEQVKAAGAIDTFTSAARGLGAELYLEAVRANTREALRARVRQARIAGGECYGYDRRRVTDASGKQSTVAVVNEAHAEVIRRVFAAYTAGAGYKRIAIDLNNAGIPFPAVGKRGSGSWSPGQIFEMVRRERYRGVYVHGAVNRVKKGGRRISVVETDESKIMRVEIPEWRIVDDLTWRRAQAMLAERAPKSQADRTVAIAKRNSENRASTIIGGLGVCTVCGGSIGVVSTRSTGRLTVKAYGCLWHQTRGDKVCPVKTRRPVSMVDRRFNDALRVAIERPDVVAFLLSAVRAEVEEQAVAAASIDLSALETERIELRRKARNLGNAIATFAGDENGIPPALLEQLANVNARTVQVEKAFAAASRAPVEAAALIAQAEATVRAGLDDLRGALAADGQLTRELVKRLIPDGLRFTPDDHHGWIVEAGINLGRTTGDPSGSGVLLPLRFAA